MDKRELKDLIKNQVLIYSSLQSHSEKNFYGGKNTKLTL